MSRGPWKSKQPQAPPRQPAGPMREISDLFLELSAQKQRQAQTYGMLSAWFRTIGLASGELLPGEDTDADAPLLEQRSAQDAA